jgi:hypothetical protein
MAEPADVRSPAHSEPLQPQRDTVQNAGTYSIPGNNTPTIATSAPARQYLNLKPLKKLDLPHHPSYDNASSDHNVNLVQFLDNLFSEVQRIDFDEGVEKRGIWSPKNGHVMMPPLNIMESSDANPVPVSVEKRIKDVNQASWSGRTSFHSDVHVKFSELSDLLAKDHSRNEAAYTPSVFDAVELLRWNDGELLNALQQSAHQQKIHSAEMFSTVLIEYVACPSELLLTYCSIPNVPHDAQGRWAKLATRPRLSCTDSYCKHVSNGEYL